MYYFRDEAKSALAVFMQVFYLGRIGIWRCWFVEGGKPENPEKNPRGKVRTNKLSPFGTGPESNPGHIVEGQVGAVSTGPSLLPKMSLTLQNL